MGAHARLSPSGAHRWMVCAASPALEFGFPDTSSKHADEGTAAHELASMCLLANKNADAFLGRKINGFAVNDDMAEGVQAYLDYIERLRGAYTVFEEKVETWLPASPRYGFPTPREGEPAEGSGTADYLLMTPKEGNNPAMKSRMTVVDLKFGRGVQVFVSDNPQLLMYAANALSAVDMFEEFEEFVCVVVQPRVDGGWIDEATYTRDEVLEFAARVRERGAVALKLLDQRVVQGPVDEAVVLKHASPDEHACRWCKAKAVCPALGNAVLDAVSGQVSDFDDLTEETVASVPELDFTLNGKMNAVGMVEDWCTAIRAEMERRLLDGHSFQDWKLVEGRRSARAWKDAEEAERQAKEMRIKHALMYENKLKSPTQMEHSLAKYPRKWAKMNAMVVQKEGRPSVAKMGDKRPVYIAVKENDFSPVDCSDLL